MRVARLCANGDCGRELKLNARSDARCCSPKCAVSRRNKERYASDPAYRAEQARGKQAWFARVRSNIGGRGARRRSAMEDKIGAVIEPQGAQYEPLRFKFTPKVRGYCPDFVLPNGIAVEVKGWFTPADRSKMLAVKAEHPDLDLRLVLASPRQKLGRGGKTTQAEWCEKHGFPWAEKVVPPEWLDERPSPRAVQALSAGTPVSHTQSKKPAA